MNATGLLIIYGNLAVILHPAMLGLGSVPGLPRPRPLLDAFLMTGMFTTHSSFNLEPFVEGGAAEGNVGMRWVPLRISDYFPQRRGVQYTQLFAAHHWRWGGPDSQREAWADLARRIKGRHNRLYPEQPISMVRFGVTRWPIHPSGYDVARHPDQTRRDVWFSELEDEPGHPDE